MNLLARAKWPGRPIRGATVRLYIDEIRATFELPTTFGGIKLARSADASPLPGDAAACHDHYPLFVECTGYESGDGMRILHSAVNAIHISSDTLIRSKAFAYSEGTHRGVIPITPPALPVGWGHYEEIPLLPEALGFAATSGPRICELDRQESFNRLSNALRLYTSALDMTPVDVAVVVFVSVLEGLFTTAIQELGYRLALSVSYYLDSEANNRLKTFELVRELYTVRSKIVHGDKLVDSEEASAIQLTEHYAPTAERLARRCLRKIFEDRIDVFMQRTRQLDRFFTLLTLGHSVSEALGLVTGQDRSNQE